MTVEITTARSTPATPRQVKFIRELCQVLGVKNAKYYRLTHTSADAVIKSLIWERDRATPAQIRYVYALRREHGLPQEDISRWTRAQVREFVASLEKGP